MKDRSVTCAYCGTELPAEALFCGECGRAASSKPAPAPREPSPRGHVDLSREHCGQCGAELAPSDIFCGECGFVRRGINSPASQPSDTVRLDPIPWELPRSTERDDHLAPEPLPSRPPPPAALPVTPPAAVVHAQLDSDFDETRIVDRARGERFVLQFSTGESVSVTGAGLLGRNPSAEPGEFFDTLVAISDPGKSVSKTHLEFGQDAGVFWISDRFSANGTLVREPERDSRRCEPGKRYRLARGSRVDIAEQFFIVS